MVTSFSNWQLRARGVPYFSSFGCFCLGPESNGHHKADQLTSCKLLRNEAGSRVFLVQSEFGCHVSTSKCHHNKINCSPSIAAIERQVDKMLSGRLHWAGLQPLSGLPRTEAIHSSSQSHCTCTVM